MKKDDKIRVSITIEIILVIIIIFSFLDYNAECSMFDCLGKIIPFIVLIITVPLAIINLYNIQILRKKSLLIPTLIPLIIIIVFFTPSIYKMIDASKPEKSLKAIINNDGETDNYIDYIIYNDHIYYYKYNTNGYLSYGTLFMTDSKGKNTKKICELNYENNIQLSFIYKDKIYYDFDFYGEENRLTGLKRLNLNNCKEETIIENENENFNKFIFLLNTKNDNTILISQEYSDYDTDEEEYDEKVYKEYTYNLDTNEVTDNNIDNYYQSNEGISYNNQLVNSSKDKELLAYDDKNIFLCDDKKIYTIDKETLEIIEEKDLNIEIEETIKETNNISYYYSDGGLYRFNTETRNFDLITNNINITDKDYITNKTIYMINNNYIFANNIAIYDYFKTAGSEYGENILFVIDENGNRIINENERGHLNKYVIDGGKIHLIYDNGKIKSVDLK